jgi:hypothetical protein
LRVVRSACRFKGTCGRPSRQRPDSSSQRQRANTPRTLAHRPCSRVAALTLHLSGSCRLMTGMNQPRSTPCPVDMAPDLDERLGPAVGPERVRLARCRRQPCARVPRTIQSNSRSEGRADAPCGQGGRDGDRGLPERERDHSAWTDPSAPEHRRHLRRLGVPRDAFGSAMVTNVGVFGLPHAFAPLVPFSRVPIVLTLGAVRNAAVVEDTEIVVRPVAPIGVTLDHRVLDGAQAGRVARRFEAVLRDPTAALNE